MFSNDFCTINKSMINKYALKRNYQFTNLKIENPSQGSNKHITLDLSSIFIKERSDSFVQNYNPSKKPENS